ncbi:uncharacterized protein EV420DRAFT_1518276 [Desarmillaria tabescens]|uniref:Uncharacterized protein n=1 Tax=Armillaria tabescens TaxID=1929756 RepID=A0AA39ND81_ARMTA|nr:uncharacterized protein EV420DRAFT_1518276 [Desarmillaria tabescens]KAK0463446.1 hypothetical protein EV420DRAFT_1518276 [Desarmillaria tabescens]
MIIARKLIFSLTHHSDDDSPYNSNIPTDPIFIWNETLVINSAPRNNVPTFRTNLIVCPKYDEDYFGSSRGSMVYYPFDRYMSNIFAFAQDAVTNESVSLSLSSASGLVAGLKITTDVKEEDHAYWEDIEATDLGNESVNVYVTLQRSNLVIAYCLVITFTFWLVTLMICLIMITTVVFGFRQRNEIVVIPIGTVFAFTQLRSSMPGAPEGFGDILDFAGLLPCLVLLSICAATMVGIYLFADPHDSSRRTFTWGEIGALLSMLLRNNI